jgi:hypothetical protein
MTILSSRGVQFTTKPLTFAAAQRFANCLDHNAQYAEVEIVPSRRSVGKYHVSYRATDPARVAKLTAAFQGDREQRAAATADCYAVCEVPGGFQVCNLLSGACYLVSHSGACDCPDATYRCGNAVQCKHAVLVRNYQQAERETQHLSNLRPAVDAARIAANIANDFPLGDW